MRVAARAAPGLRPSIATASLHRFPRSARLLRRADFERVFAEGYRTHSRHFTLIAAASPLPARLGLAVSRRNVAKAAGRNRLKRLAREIFRQTSLPPLDVVVVARSGAASTDSKALRAELVRDFKILKERCVN